MKQILVILLMFISLNFVFTQDNNMNLQLDEETQMLLDGEVNYFGFKIIDVKNKSIPEYVSIKIVYEVAYQQARIIYSCPYELYDYEVAYVLVRNCIYTFNLENNFKRYQDIDSPRESYKMKDNIYTTEYMRYIKFYK